MLLRIVTATLLIAVPAAAQDAPKTVKTLKLSETAPSLELYAVSSDGTVAIDWKAVENVVAMGSDRLAMPTATMMLAIRDGTWKPMQAGK